MLAIAFLSLPLLQSTAARADVPGIWYNCNTRERFTPAKRVWCDRWRRVQNATFIVPTHLDPNPVFTRVRLENGRYQGPDGRFGVELVNQQGWSTFGDLNNDGRQDAVVILGVALDPDGQSIATYLTAVMDVDRAVQAIVPLRLGDRILLNAPITIRNQQVTVPLLTQTAVINRTYRMDATLLNTQP